MKINANDYAALKALYDRTDGENWTKKINWDVSSETPPDADVVGRWHGVTVVGSRVTKIELGNNNLSGTLPSFLGDLSNLQYLYLDVNSLNGTLPSFLGDLSNLQYLYLSRNSLSGTLPSFLGDLSNLQTLKLENNSLSGALPSFLGDLSNLQYLYLSRNSLSGTLPSELDSLSNLQELSLENPPYVETQISDVYAITSGEDFSLNVSGNFGDINNNITSYSASGLPQGLTINSTSGAAAPYPYYWGHFYRDGNGIGSCGRRGTARKLSERYAPL